jgi:hypothetical protein
MASEQEFAQFWANLTPQEQQQFTYTFGMGPQEQAGELASGFPVQPEFDFGQDLGNIFSANVPQLTAKGKVDPLDLSQMMSRLNYTQDVGGSMFDMAQTLFAGPDAWGDPSAFEPITTYTGKAVPAVFGDDGTPRPVSVSDQMLDRYIASGGYEAFIADLIKNGGLSSSQAVAQMRQIVESGANATDPKLKQQALDIRNTMPVRVLPTTNSMDAPVAPIDRATAAWNNFDEEGVLTWARGLEKDKTEADLASATLQFDPKTGQFYEGIKTEDSPTALKFRNAGLPTPFDKFDDPEYIEKAWQQIQPNYQQDVAAHQADVGQQTTDWNALAAEYVKQSQAQGQLQQAWNKAQPQAPAQAGTFRTPTPGMAATGATPPVGRFAATNPQAAASTTIPSMGALGRSGMPPTQAQQTGQMQGALASQFRPNPLAYDFGSPTRQITPTDAQMASIMEGSLASNFRPNAPTPGRDAQVFYVGDDKTPHLITQGEGVRFGPEGPPVRFNTLNQGDMKNAKNKTNAARKQATDAYSSMYKQASQGSPGSFDRAYTAAMLRGQAKSGQTPLQVALLARLASLGQRAGLGG